MAKKKIVKTTFPKPKTSEIIFCVVFFCLFMSAILAGVAQKYGYDDARIAAKILAGECYIFNRNNAGDTYSCIVKGLK
jgi:hypothetical protein